MGWIIGLFVLLFIIGVFLEGIKKFKTSKTFRRRYLFIALLIILLYTLNKEFSWVLTLLLLAPNIWVGFGIFKGKLAQSILAIQLEEWLQEDAPNFSLTEIQKMLKGPARVFYEEDTNPVKFHEENIPYGRANAFLHHFEKSIELEDVLFYAPKRSLEEIELREYGTMLTNAGLYIAHQYLVHTKTKEYAVDLFDIRFKGLFHVELGKHGLTMLYNDFTGIRITEGQCSFPLPLLHELCQHLIDNKFTLALLQEKIVDDTIVQGANYVEAIKEEERRFQQNLAQENREKGAVHLGTFGAMDGIIGEFGELKNLMDGRQGHGYAAEYGNNAMDRLQLKKVENVGAKLENGRQVKHGADRRVNGVEIQTKYCQTADKTLGEIFQGGKLKYVGKDGKPMQVEVPRDQYKEAVRKLQDKIDRGEVEGVEKGTKAESILRKGFWLYRDSLLIAKSGTIQSLVVDTATGAVIALKASGISAVITFATSIWAGKTLKESMEATIHVSGKVLGRSTAIYALTAQLSRKEFVNYFSKSMIQTKGKGLGYNTIQNPVRVFSDKAAIKLQQSSLAKSTLGQKMKLTKISGQTIIGSGIMMAFTFGPDVSRALVGRISLKQLFKNAATTSAAIAGAAIGNTFMPVVGAFVGGAVAGAIAKGVLNEFIEDDAKEMYQILKEEFLDGVMLFSLQKTEFDEVMSITLGNAELPHVLREMYASKEARKYARELLIHEALIMVLSKRQRITEEIMDEALGEFVEAEYQVGEALA